MKKVLDLQMNMVGRGGFEPPTNWLKASTAYTAFHKFIHALTILFQFVQSCNLPHLRALRIINLQKFLTAVLFCSAAAFADETPGRSQDCQYRTECTFTDWHDPWRTADTARQLVFLSLLYVDMRQTLEDLDNPNHREANRILGDHPSRGRVQGYTAAVALLHTAGAWVMPKEARGPFQYVSIIIEGRTVYQNYKLGIRVGTNF